MLKKPDRRSLLYLSVVIIAAILICVGSFYFLSQLPEIEIKPAEKKPAEKTMEEVIKDLTAPFSEEEIQVSEEVLKGLTTPGSGEEAFSVSEDVIKDLTAPE